MVWKTCRSMGSFSPKCQGKSKETETIESAEIAEDSGHTRRKTRQSRGCWIAIFAMLVLLPFGVARAQVRLNPSNPTGAGADWVTLTGTVVDRTTNAPVAGVEVLVSSSGSGAAVQAVFTDGDGRFYASVPPGSHRLQVEAKGYEPAQEIVGPDGANGPIEIVIQKSAMDATPETEAVVSVTDLKAPGKAVKAYNKGLEDLQKKHVEKAEEEFRRAIAVYPKYSEAYYKLGVTEFSLGQQAEAVKDLQRAIELTNGRHAGARFAMGAVLCEQKRYSEGLRSVEGGEALDPGSFEGPLFKGQALFGLGRLNEAETSELEALRRRPEIPLAYVILANIHLREHKDSELLEDLDHFLKLEPTGATSDTARHAREQAVRRIADSSSREVAAATNR